MTKNYRKHFSSFNMAPDSQSSFSLLQQPSVTIIQTDRATLILRSIPVPHISMKLTSKNLNFLKHRFVESLFRYQAKLIIFLNTLSELVSWKIVHNNVFRSVLLDVFDYTTVYRTIDQSRELSETLTLFSTTLIYKGLFWCIIGVFHVEFSHMISCGIVTN